MLTDSDSSFTLRVLCCYPVLIKQCNKMRNISLVRKYIYIYIYIYNNENDWE